MTNLQEAAPAACAREIISYARIAAMDQVHAGTTGCSSWYHDTDSLSCDVQVRWCQALVAINAETCSYTLVFSDRARLD
jgi:hypothetical protein